MLTPQYRSANLYVRGVRSRKRQAGAEMVEFAITLLLFLIVFVLTIDISIFVYNQGVANLATREGARQGSLYWVNPSAYDDTDPAANMRMKEAMIYTAVNYVFDNLLINPGNVSIPSGTISYNVNLQGQGVVRLNSYPNREWVGVSDARVTVDLRSPHDFMVLPNLLPVAPVRVRNATSLETESTL